MAASSTKPYHRSLFLLFLFFFFFTCAALSAAYAAPRVAGPRSQHHHLLLPRHLGKSSETATQGVLVLDMAQARGRRVMIGSSAPICTYNECRGCKHKCRAEQVPVEANDPINSAYHYKCVCHSHT